MNYDVTLCTLHYTFCCIMNYDVTLYTLHCTGDSRSVNEDQMLCNDNNIIVDDVIIHHDNDVTMVTDDNEITEEKVSDVYSHII